jgi:hypothetical protein
MAGKEGEATVNMSQAELKLIALGTRFMENGKVSISPKLHFRIFRPLALSLP